MVTSRTSVRTELKSLADPEKATQLARFFKTGPGQYGEGDIFYGITVPMQRSVAKKYSALPRKEVTALLRSEVHEERLTALLILVEQYRKQPDAREEIIREYLANTRWINNWDLVDLSAPRILGAYLVDHDRSILYELATSEVLWEKRISIIATFAFIDQGESHDALQIAEILLSDSHDLIHKAVGWVLREVGKKCGQKTEEAFLKEHYAALPRTTLRYAIERFPEALRLRYLRGELLP
jgi:3-methyladenine DNA glycosylase AlkD